MDNQNHQEKRPYYPRRERSKVFDGLEREDVMFLDELIFWFHQNNVKLKLKDNQLFIGKEHKPLLTDKISGNIKLHRVNLIKLLQSDYGKPIVVIRSHLLDEEIALVPNHMVWVGCEFEGKVAYKRSEYEVVSRMTDEQIIGYHTMKKLFKPYYINIIKDDGMRYSGGQWRKEETATTVAPVSPQQ
jgi:hypothetical protein